MSVRTGWALALFAIALAPPAAAWAAQDDDAPRNAGAFEDDVAAYEDEASVPVTEGTPASESTILVYGDDSCPQSEGSDVVVCARRPEEERYRIPRNLRRSSQPAEQSWASRVESLEAASREARPGSCSVVGSYGQSGCMQQMIGQWLAERRARSRSSY